MVRFFCRAWNTRVEFNQQHLVWRLMYLASS